MKQALLLAFPLLVSTSLWGQFDPGTDTPSDSISEGLNANPYTINFTDGSSMALGGSSGNAWQMMNWSSDFESIQVGDKLFSDLQVSQSTSTLGTPVALMNISYAGVVDDDGNIGIAFGISDFSAFQTADGEGGFEANAESFVLSYQVEVLDPNKAIIGAANDMNGAGANTSGVAVVEEQVRDTATNTLLGSDFTTTLGGSLGPPDNPTNSITFADTPSQKVTVTKNLGVESGADLNGFAAISGIVQTFTQVPEPSTYAAIFGGVSLLVALVRRRLYRR